MEKLRVLHLFNHYLPQTENWAYNLISNLPATETFIGAKHYLKNNFYHPDFTFYEHPYGEIQKQYLRWGKKNPIDFTKKAIFKIAQPFLGNMRKGLSVFAKNNQIDLVHAHFGDIGWYFKGIPNKLDLPYVVSFYGWDYNLLPNQLPVYKQRFKKLFEDADLFLCEGEYGAQRLQKMGCPFDKIKIQKLGVLSNSIPVFIRKKRKDQLNLVQVATFTEKKGHIYTIKSFEKALEHCPNMHLTLVGGESPAGLKNGIENLIDKRGLKEKVTILDQIDYSRLYEFLADFHVFIQPSCHANDGDCEGGAPIVLLDAQATGMPVISTTHCDISMEVKHGITGLLTPEKNIDQLIDGITSFYRMKDARYQTFCEAAHRHISKEYNIVSNALQLKNIYDLLR